MKRILVLITTLLLMLSCKTIYVPVKGDTIVKDSLIVETRIDTLEVKLPPERIRDWTGLLDTLTMETSLATSHSWIDTTKGILAGELVNKETPMEVYVPSTHTLEKKDSLVYQEVPIEVEKIEYKTPRWAWYSVIGNVVVLLLAGLGIYLKLKGIKLK